MQDDPLSALTLCALRRMINNGTIPVIDTAQKRKMFDYDVLLQYLQTGTSKTDVAKPEAFGEIRRID